MIHSNKYLMACTLLLVVLSLSFRESYSDTPRFWEKAGNVENSGTSVILALKGNVYPDGYFSTSLNIGNPPKLFDLDIDTGSDFTWLECNAPCERCSKPPHLRYDPTGKKKVKCQDPICATFQPQGNLFCPDDQCDYLVEYADGGSSRGFLIYDSFHLQPSSGPTLERSLVFGCGIDQQYSDESKNHPTIGVLGLGSGKVSILTQLQGMGTIRKVLSHCLSSRGGGYIFLGDDVVPSQISWTPMATTSNYYASGPAELLYNDKSTGIKGLQINFDSGATYTYFSSNVYQAVLELIKGDLEGKPLKDVAEDKTLSVCWEGVEPFESVDDVKNYFRPFTLNFQNANNVQLQLPPESYLVVAKNKIACLGIFDASKEEGLVDINVIGGMQPIFLLYSAASAIDISMLDKLIIYDNEKKQIGWAPANCDKIPES